jgi:hypothetical protein
MPCASDCDAVMVRDRKVPTCVDLQGQILACSLIYERGDKTLLYGRRIPSTDPNQDFISANCQTDEQMITVRETAWTRCHMRLTVLTMLNRSLATRLGSGPATSEPDRAQRR